MKIAFIGYGIEAESAYRYFKDLYPGAHFTAYDTNAEPKRAIPRDVDFSGSVSSFHDIDADIVVRTPSVNPRRITTRGDVTSVTSEFFKMCNKPIIGVTGTKGKGTTSSLITHILRRCGKQAWLVGNIGTSALDALDEINRSEDGLVVYEMSSFQLWDLEQSPHIAVVLPIEQEHLDTHDGFDDYVAAKAHIATHQTHDDVIVYYEHNPIAASIARQSGARQVSYTQDVSADEQIIFAGKPLLDVDEINLRGVHNIQNINAALSAAQEITDDRKAVAAALCDFRGLPHRIEEVGLRDGVLYVNDSFSSAPPATVAAVRSYTEPITLILGGFDRGIDFKPLAQELAAVKNIAHIVLLGQTARRLRESLRSVGLSVDHIARNLHDAFDVSKSITASGGIILLSPGCASFDMFQNFEERGDTFRELVGAVQREFMFESYSFDKQTGEAEFIYSFDHYDMFNEKVVFDVKDGCDYETLDRALLLAFLLIGTSYSKLFPGSRVNMGGHHIDAWQAHFLGNVYQEGMSQYAYENNLTRDNLLHFEESPLQEGKQFDDYDGSGILSLQSGGKDSLLTAQLLSRSGQEFESLYIASRGGNYPSVINNLPGAKHIIERVIDIAALTRGQETGGLNGHVPVTFIVLAIATVQAVLLSKDTIIASIGHEGEEPHATIGDLSVTHQWSKTWGAEQLMAEYVNRYVSPNIKIGSLLRGYSELRVAELFIQHAWADFGQDFSSCNVANYKQGSDNSKLTWCGVCPKCANSYLLFAPFLPATDLKKLFNGQDLFRSKMLGETFRGLLGVGDTVKPFECVGEIDELRLAYHMAQERGGYAELPFTVPASQFDYKKEYPVQPWVPALK